MSLLECCDSRSKSTMLHNGCVKLRTFGLYTSLLLILVIPVERIESRKIYKDADIIGPVPNSLYQKFVPKICTKNSLLQPNICHCDIFLQKVSQVNPLKTQFERRATCCRNFGTMMKAAITFALNSNT